MTAATFTLAALVPATVTSGLLAGVYLLYAHTVMPGLRTLGDREFVGAFQALDRAILNAWFADPTAARRDFDGPRWVRWTLVRVVTSIAATGCLAWALVLTGRAPG